MEPTQKKGKSGLIITIIILLVIAAGIVWFVKKNNNTPAPVPADALSATPYTQASSSFAIRFPEGWTVDDAGQFGALVFAVNPTPDIKDEAKFSSNMNITSEDVQAATLDEYISITQEALPKFLSDYKVTEDRVVTVGGIPARIIGGTFTQGQLKLRNIQLVVIKDGKAYVVTATSLASSWNAYKAVMEASAMTFTLK